MFRALLFIVVILPLLGFYSFWRDAQKQQWLALNPETLKMYVDAVKTILTASGLAVAAIVASLGGRLSTPIWIVERAVTCLVMCIVCAPLTVFVLYRCYDRARSRHHEVEPRDPYQQGALTSLEYLLLLLMAYATVEGFILGFLYLARIPFWIHPTSS